MTNCSQRAAERSGADTSLYRCVSYSDPYDLPPCWMIALEQCNYRFAAF